LDGLAEGMRWFAFIVALGVVVVILVIVTLLRHRAHMRLAQWRLSNKAGSSLAERDDREPRNLPYRDGYLESPVDSPTAQALLTTAHDHHFSKRFQDARVIYQQIVEQHGATKQATVARQQLENLSKV
jgi:hypothetical protein